MDLAASVTEPCTDHRDVGHGGELDHEKRRGLQKHVLELQDVRAAVFQKENFLSGGVSSCGVGEYHVRVPSAGHRQDGVRGVVRRDHAVADCDVLTSECLEVGRSSFAQGRVHLVVVDTESCLAEGPVVCP